MFEISYVFKKISFFTTPKSDLPWRTIKSSLHVYFKAPHAVYISPSWSASFAILKIDFGAQVSFWWSSLSWLTMAGDIGYFSPYRPLIIKSPWLYVTVPSRVKSVPAEIAIWYCSIKGNLKVWKLSVSNQDSFILIINKMLRALKEVILDEKQLF